MEDQNKQQNVNGFPSSVEVHSFSSVEQLGALPDNVTGNGPSRVLAFLVVSLYFWHLVYNCY